MKQPLSDILAQFSRKTVIVVGDVMLDRFIYGRTERVSPEAPTLVLAGDNQMSTLGGACNVGLNIAELGGTAELIGLVGADDTARELDAIMARNPRLRSGLIASDGRKTTEKIRLINPQYNTHLLRLDWDDARATDPRERAALVARTIDAIGRADAVVISDYLKGVIDDDFVAAILPAAKAKGIPIVVDPKAKDFRKYAGATVIAPNLTELSGAIGRAVPQDDAAIETAAAELCEKADVAALVVKRSQHGVQVVEGGQTLVHYPTLATRVVDVSGAGDTVVAGLALALATGCGLEEAAQIANAAAGVVVAKYGTATVSLAELSEILLHRRDHAISPKYFEHWGELRAKVAAWQEQGLSVGFTNGCFDLLHPGHVWTLTQARNRVDRLVLALNTDRSVSALKGPTRPVQKEEARATVAAALEAIDAVTLFDEDTPLELINAIRPNVVIKGGDYSPDTVVGRAEVESWGGRVEIIPYIPETSTTLLIQRMQS